jgi:aspartate/tyrosine/aromatic aminotransferase
MQWNTSLSFQKYSNPAGHGARIVGRILTDPELFRGWCQELAEIAETLKNRRRKLRERLEKLLPGRDWCPFHEPPLRPEKIFGQIFFFTTF